MKDCLTQDDGPCHTYLMTYIIAGLGNPGEEYKDTRHNTGRMMLQVLAKECDFDDFSFNKKANALVTKGEIEKKSVTLIAPETFMNKSGVSVGPFVTTMGKLSPKKAEQLIVIYDDFNLPLGSIRVSFNRSSGGHNGLESIIKAAKTEAFVRIRVGVAPANAKGLAKVPHGEKEIETFILSKFKPAEVNELKVVMKKVVGAVKMIISEGKEKAMSVYNSHNI